MGELTTGTSDMAFCMVIHEELGQILLSPESSIYQDLITPSNREVDSVGNFTFNSIKFNVKEPKMK